MTVATADDDSADDDDDAAADMARVWTRRTISRVRWLRMRSQPLFGDWSRSDWIESGANECGERARAAEWSSEDERVVCGGRCSRRMAAAAGLRQSKRTKRTKKKKDLSQL